MTLALTPNPAPIPYQVYQENVYGGAKFASFKRALGKLRDAAARGDAAAAETVARTQLVSFHSTSKGFFAECLGRVESAVLVVPSWCRLGLGGALVPTRAAH